MGAGGYRIVEVDGADPATIQVIQRLDDATAPCAGLLDTLEGHWWIVYHGKQPVAFGALVPSQQWPLTGYLCRAGVIWTHRGKGLQKRLIKVRERKAKKLGWIWLITATDVANAPSANSMIRCGFKMYWPDIPWFVNAVYWRRRIGQTPEAPT